MNKVETSFLMAVLFKIEKIKYNWKKITKSLMTVVNW